MTVHGDDIDVLIDTDPIALGDRCRRAERLVGEAQIMLAEMVSADACWFDHNGSCQAHGWFFPEPGEICPEERAKRWLAALTGEGGE